MRYLITLFTVSLCLMIICQSCEPADLEKLGSPERYMGFTVRPVSN